MQVDEKGFISEKEVEVLRMQVLSEDLGNLDSAWSHEQLFALGLLCERGAGVVKDEERARVLYQKAAKKGHPMAKFQLAAMYEEGRGGGSASMEESYATKALDLYKEAAEAGFANAQYKMGRLYEIGNNVVGDKNIELAIQYYKQAAFGGHALAVYRLSYLNK